MIATARSAMMMIPFRHGVGGGGRGGAGHRSLLSRVVASSAGANDVLPGRASSSRCGGGRSPADDDRGRNSSSSSSPPPPDAASSASSSGPDEGGDRPTIGGDDDDDVGRSMGPTGDLFHAEVGPDLVGRSASVRRTFGPRSNAEALLACGGSGLARHASFDRDYGRAREWIRRHPVGPAVVGPVLIDGLVGALVEAALPQSVPVRSGSRQIGPLIVGVEVEARIEVESVRPTGPVVPARRRKAARRDDTDGGETSGGYEVSLRTEATRARDGSIVAEGTHAVWIPDYMHM